MGISSYRYHILIDVPTLRPWYITLTAFTSRIIRHASFYDSY